MDFISRNHTSVEAKKYSSPPTHNVIALAIATVPIIILILIIVSFKICEKVCPQGQRREFISRPRRISTQSTLSTTISRNNSSCHVGSSSSHQGFSGSGSHLNLNYVHSHHHQQHVTIRADGTPLLVTDLETIREPEEDEEQPLSFQVNVYK